MFRRRAARRAPNDVTAPRVYFEYCTEEVLVSELVSGVWIWEIMAAVDRDDQEFLGKLRDRGIEPKALASKLIMIMNREVQEEAFYHADPHPANIVVMPDNRVCFIDFGAIGRFSTQTKKMHREMAYHMAKGDIGRMVNASLGLGGPLPPIDVDAFRKELDKIFADWVYAQNSRDAEWWERSMAQAWLRTMEVAQQYHVPMNFETIQYFRAAFAYDAIVNRLNKDLDAVKEYRVYIREVAKRARLRVRKKMKSRLTGPTDVDYLQMEQFGDTVSQFLFNLERSVENPIVQFKAVIGKIAYISRLVLRLGYLVAAGFGIALLANVISTRWFGHEINWSAVLGRATTFGWVQLLLILLALVVIRRIVIRLSMPDSKPD
jgi:predicted unusual protein kinase regulating ubiquinone biosynthesis (AarF/ABC1/UbiB family)